MGGKNGGDRKTDRQNVVLKTQSDIALNMGFDTRTYQRYKQFADMIPELTARKRKNRAINKHDLEYGKLHKKLLEIL